MKNGKYLILFVDKDFEDTSDNIKDKLLNGEPFYGYIKEYENLCELIIKTDPDNIEIVNRVFDVNNNIKSLKFLVVDLHTESPIILLYEGKLAKLPDMLPGNNEILIEIEDFTMTGFVF